jgi:serine protease Do
MAAHLPVQTLQSLAPMLQNIMPAIVNVNAQGEVPVNAPFNPEQSNYPATRAFESLGSGVVVDAERGYILTNAHVINHAKILTVTLSDGRSLSAKLLGSDSPSDIAVLQIHADKLTAIRFGNSDSLKVGDFVAAIGNPFGLDQTVTSGIISGLKRNNLGIEGYENFIQTDASINPGNSGGALVNMQGQLIGINTAIFTPSGGNIGIGFAIPINTAQAVMQQLLQYGEVKRGLVGVLLQTLTPELSSVMQAGNKQGAIVTQIIPNSPAAGSGLKAGDIITKVNGLPVKDAPAVHNTIGLMRVNTKIALDIIRDGKDQKIVLTTADPKQYQQHNQGLDPFLYGLGLRNFDEQVPGQGHITGVQIVSIAKNSPAARAMLQRGDIIVSANRQPLTNIIQLQQAAKLNHDRLLLNILRNTGAYFVVIKSMSDN